MALNSAAPDKGYETEDFTPPHLGGMAAKFNIMLATDNFISTLSRWLLPPRAPSGHNLFHWGEARRWRNHPSTCLARPRWPSDSPRKSRALFRYRYEATS